MAPSPPQGFVDLQTAYRTHNQDFFTIGIVVESLPAVPTRGTDWQMTLTLQDPSLLGSFTGGLGLRVKLFASETKLPKVQAQGDVVILRRVKVKEWSGSVIAISNWATECIVFPSASIPDPHYKDPYVSGRQQIQHSSSLANTAIAPTLAEQLYVIDLRQWYLENQAMFPVPQNAPRAPLAMTTAPTASKAAPSKKSGVPTDTSTGSGSSRDRFALIKDINDHQFYDLVGEVLKTHPSSSGTLEVYITDYTENKLLWYYETPQERAETSGGLRDGDAYGYLGQAKKEWTGPYGQLTLQIKMWPPHAYWTQTNINAGDCIFVRNVHIKYNESTSTKPKLEGALHEDRKRPDQIDVRRVRSTDPRVEQLIRRKREYYARMEEDRLKAAGDAREPEKLSKGQRAKRNKRKKQQDQSEREQLGRSLQVESAVAHKSNQHIRSSHIDTPITSIRDILDSPYLSDKAPSGTERQLPFINMRCRARVRVVDFYPSQLEDFAQCLDDSSYNDVAPQSDNEETLYMDSSSSQRPTSWEWAFYLLVEDAKPPPGTEKPVRMKLLVAADDAVHLLKLDATDLRKDTRTLAQLREKLFILWGNLEELKAAGEPLRPGKEASSNAFECCIQEYGAPVEAENDTDDTSTEWTRMHRMFGTTIM